MMAPRGAYNANFDHESGYFGTVVDLVDAFCHSKMRQTLGISDIYRAVNSDPPFVLYNGLVSYRISQSGIPPQWFVNALVRKGVIDKLNSDGKSFYDVVEAVRSSGNYQSTFQAKKLKDLEKCFDLVLKTQGVGLMIKEHLPSLDNLIREHSDQA